MNGTLVYTLLHFFVILSNWQKLVIYYEDRHEIIVNIADLYIFSSRASLCPHLVLRDFYRINMKSKTLIYFIERVEWTHRDFYKKKKFHATNIFLSISLNINKNVTALYI